MQQDAAELAAAFVGCDAEWAEDACARLSRRTGEPRIAKIARVVRRETDGLPGAPRQAIKSPPDRISAEERQRE